MADHGRKVTEALRTRSCDANFVRGANEDGNQEPQAGLVASDDR